MSEAESDPAARLDWTDDSPASPAPAAQERRGSGLRRYLRSTAVRLGLLYAAIFFVSTCILLTGVYWTSTSHMRAQSEASLETELELLQERYATRGLQALVNLIEERIETRGELVYILTSPVGEPVTGNLPAWPRGVTRQDGWLGFDLQRFGPGGRVQPRPALAKAYVLNGGWRLLVGRDIGELSAIKQNLAQTLAFGLLASLALALCGAGLAARAAARRVEQIHRTCDRIMTGDLGQRVPSGDSGDDFDQLATSINAMLERIEAAMDDLRRMADNIAHDLRTPLARLRSRLETMAADEPHDTDGAAQARAALQEIDGVLATFNALLRIARLESAARHAAPAEQTTFDLNELLADAMELYEPLAADKQQTIQLRTSAPTVQLSGMDKSLIFQMIANLLDNAVKFSPRASQIELDLAAAGTGHALTVRDHGPGIPTADQGKVFQRFFRGDQARHSEGNGLGLTLVKAVADRYGLEVVLENANPGLAVKLTLPA